LSLKTPTIVLVRPQLPENIGMVARVMSNFGLKNLIIVKPRDNWFNIKSTNAAKKAKTILNNVKVYNNLNEALKNFTYVISTTNRKRYLNKNSTIDFKLFNKKINSNKKIAILFGPENSGLSNEDLRLTDLIFTIETNNKNKSLNLSHAVTVICYKIFESNNIKNNKNIKRVNDLVNKGQISKYFDFLFQKLENRNFFVPKEKTESMKNNIYNIYLKSSLSKKELQTLWGITKKLTK